MKAPDVIYVEFSEEVNLAFEEQPFEETPTYIRKEALLEWAKEKKKQLLDQVSENDEPSDVAAGINAGLDMLIGKLKSM